MTYATEIAEAQQEAMPEFYEFFSGGEFSYYTSFNEGLIFKSNSYAPTSIRRGGFSQDTQFGKVEVQISAAITDLFAQYIANLPLEPVTVTIYRAIKSDLSDYIILFTGTVKSVTIKDRTASARCESRSTLLEARLPRIIYQSFCNHDVFDDGCGLNEVAWRVTATITGISGYTLTSTSFGAKPNKYFTGGRIQFLTDHRLVTAHDGSNDLNLQLPFDARLGIGDSVFALPGCDGNPSTCKNKFNNLTKYLGMPYIPSHNPAIWGFK